MRYVPLAESINQIGVVQLGDPRFHSSLGGPIPNLDDFYLRIKSSQPRGPHGKWQSVNSWAIVDKKDQMIHLGQCRVDHVLMPSVQRCKFAKRQANLHDRGLE
jgi:hypothetical protein